jgi:hypothetical protein
MIMGEMEWKSDHFINLRLRVISGGKVSLLVNPRIVSYILAVRNVILRFEGKRKIRNILGKKRGGELKQKKKGND